MSTDTPQPAEHPGPHTEPGQRLPCGADVDDLLEQVAEGHADRRDAHQAGCPHCQAALTEFADLWAPVQRLADQPVHTPTTLVADIMRHVERLTRNVWYTLHHTDTGAIRVATRVVAALARQAALRVPGVRVALGRSSDTATARTADTGTRRHRHSKSAVGVLGRTAIVDLALTVTYGQPINDIAQQVQQRVTQELEQTIGLQQVAVNIIVDDVLPPAPGPR